MMNVAQQCTQQVARYAAPAAWRLWLRGMLKNGIHNATGTVMAGLGTNGIQGLAPESLWQYTDGIAMSFNQCVAVFVISLGLSALKYVHAATAPTGKTKVPFVDQ